MMRSIGLISVANARKLITVTFYRETGNILKSSFSSTKQIMAGLEKVILGMGKFFCARTIPDQFITSNISKLNLRGKGDFVDLMTLS